MTANSQQEYRQKRFNELSEYLNNLSCDDYSYNEIISLDFNGINYDCEFWVAVINISGYEIQGKQFCENAKHLVKFDLNGKVLSVDYENI